MRNWVTALRQLFFPQICVVCNELLKKEEESICVICEAGLPILPYKFGDGNPIEQLFYNRVSLKGANALLNFIEKGKTQKIIHAIKYQNHTEFAYILGKKAATQCQISYPYFKPDFVLPVPLHQSKLLKRGYNQSDFIAKGMAEVWKTVVNKECVKRIVATKTQTKKSRKDRYLSMQNVFESIHPEQVRDKIIVVVDDVITTGATLDSLCTELNNHSPKAIYVYALAAKM